MGNAQYKVTLLSRGNKKSVDCEGGTTLMDVFRKNNIYVEAPCGGRGICGKCKVRILKGEVSAISHDESRFLSNKEKQEGYRLACMTQVIGDVEVATRSNLGGAQIMATGIEYSVDILPQIKKKFVQLDIPTVEDQRDDLRRLADATGIDKPNIQIELVRKLPQILRDSNFGVTVVYDGHRILNVEMGDTRAYSYGVAIDIGTTTLVCYLMDLTTGRQIDTISDLNVQKAYGGDVISRIQYTTENQHGLSGLSRGITKQISELIKEVAYNNDISMDYIYNIVIAGNTIMGHLLLGITPQHIATTPFTPVITQSEIFLPHELGLKLGMASRIFILPHISGYVGADVVAGILASGMDRDPDLCLIIDIGTNGEMVLGNEEKMVCCSTAAGPAFEGANIRHGVGGVSGAINTIMLDGDKLKYTTIEDKAPIGICGSGIVDALAVLLDAGIVDETGRLLDADEIESGIGQKLTDRLTEVEGLSAFIIAHAHVSETGEAIVITQKDIREIQLAKAAIAAGVKVLIKKMGKNIDEVVRLYLAGGFGSYIDRRNAARIGLIPPELEQRIIAIGNGAGTGAMLSLLSSEHYSKTNDIRNMAEYVELSSTLEFQDEYVNSMYFD